MNLNVTNKLIKKTRRWHKKTGFALFQRAAAHFEQKKKETIFSVIDGLQLQPEEAGSAEPAQSRIIWICWFQGLESAPELVKRCIASVQNNAPDAQVIILTDENIPDYLALPEHIKTKYQAGLISKAQYSDIVRCSLLYQYGGIWMDATVFLTRPVPESFYQRTFSSLRFDVAENALSQGYWTAYFLAAQKGNALVKLVRDILYRYWQHHDALIEYFLIDYSFLYARERYPQFRQIMDMQPVTGNNRFLIRQFISSKPDVTAMTALNQDPVGIYKLSHKEQYRTSDSGQPTVYSKILDGSFSLKS
ncbi:capsular polysaccharide synthesis protein [Enterobacter wuhouensis]|uniref:Capsular polysaccharide synthesis protein n=1 Tax=Enterobacter wuhouensis TaxID=2529381 RepID=A0ABZ1DKC9_9ENTR|nr:capsular polysaccharide synthesis protein [Enterobacter wuhouensis]WRW31736.1 capsular polysaccharide synthesis protein [Enterobacter wuhouensis]